MTPPLPDAADTLVVGGGLIGSAIARELARRGQRVTLVDDPDPAAASGVAAGMLAPVGEATFTDLAIIDLNLASLRRWEAFDRGLSAEGLASGLRRHPTLLVGRDADDADRLAQLARFLVERGLPATTITRTRLRREEPLLDPGVRAGVSVPGDWSCDNRVLRASLHTSLERHGVVRVAGRAVALVDDGGRTTGVRLADGTTLAGTQVVVAAGAWAPELLGDDLGLRPVGGQTVRLRAGSLPRLGATVRGFTSGFDAYLVPRENGELVIGATVEQRGFDARPSADSVRRLLTDARALVPLTAEYEFVEVASGLRPGTPDNAPVIDRLDPGLVVAVGHHRNGVLLTPVTADLVADLVEHDTRAELAAPFGAARLRARVEA